MISVVEHGQNLASSANIYQSTLKDYVYRSYNEDALCVTTLFDQTWSSSIGQLH